MFESNNLPRRILAAGTMLGAIVLATQSFAGECPANKVGVDVTKPGATAPQGVTDKVVTSINLADAKVGLKGYSLRMRRLVVEPNGVVPWHSHAERPAIIYIESGTILEYSSACAEPIVHKAVEATPELKHMSHWWKNTGTTPVVIIAFDLFHEKQDPKAM
jgi:quercetin dioxygenase-like cupin family protein